MALPVPISARRLIAVVAVDTPSAVLFLSLYFFSLRALTTATTRRVVCLVLRLADAGNPIFTDASFSTDKGDYRRLRVVRNFAGWACFLMVFPQYFE